MSSYLVPPIPIPKPQFESAAELRLPTFRSPIWEPIPFTRNDIPSLQVPQTQPKDLTEEKQEEEEEEEESTNKQSKEDKPKEKLQPIQPQQVPLPSIQAIPLPPRPVRVDHGPPAAVLQEVQTVAVPLIDIEVPLPRTEILVVAVSTASVAAVASVGGTLIATTLFKKIVKISQPLIKAVLKKLAKARNKKTTTWGRQQWESRQRRRLRKHSQDEA